MSLRSFRLFFGLLNAVCKKQKPKSTRTHLMRFSPGWRFPLSPGSALRPCVYASWIIILFILVISLQQGWMKDVLSPWTKKKKKLTLVRSNSACFQKSESYASHRSSLKREYKHELSQEQASVCVCVVQMHSTAASIIRRKHIFQHKRPISWSAAGMLWRAQGRLFVFLSNQMCNALCIYGVSATNLILHNKKQQRWSESPICETQSVTGRMIRLLLIYWSGTDLGQLPNRMKSFTLRFTFFF